VLQLLSTFWPFVLDVFFNKKTLLHPLTAGLIKLVVGGVIVLTLLIALYQGIGKLFFETHDRYLEISEKYIDLEKKHQDIIAEKNTCYAESLELKSKITTVTLDITHLLETQCGCKEKLEALNASLSKCNTAIPATNTTNDINALLKATD